MKKMNTLFCILFWVSFVTCAQKQVLSTDSLVINGLVTESKTISFSEILEWKKEKIGSFNVTNHLGEFRKKYIRLEGVSLLEILELVEFKYPNPKVLSEYYFVLRAIDGYAVVISWNELYNTEIGKGFFIITSIDGKSAEHMEESILFISTKDDKTGRRHVKGLAQIEVKRIDNYPK